MTERAPVEALKESLPSESIECDTASTQMDAFKKKEIPILGKFTTNSLLSPSANYSVLDFDGSYDF